MNDTTQPYEVVFEDTGEVLKLVKDDRNVKLFFGNVLFGSKNIDLKKPEWLYWDTNVGEITCANDDATREKLSWLCANNRTLLTIDGPALEDDV